MATNWDKAKTAYVTGNAGYIEIAKRYKASVRDVERHGSQEGWVAARRAYRGKVAERAYARAQDADVMELERLRAAAATICARLDEITRSADELYTHAAVVGVSKGVSEIAEKRLTSVDARKLRDVAESIKTMAAAMSALGEMRKGAQTEDGNEGVAVTWATSAARELAE